MRCEFARFFTRSNGCKVRDSVYCNKVSYLDISIILTFSCQDQKKALAVCLQRSPCVLIERNTPKDCLTKPELKKNLPELCVANFLSYMECKNGYFDMSKRMRGNAPLSTGKYDQVYENLSSGNFDAREEMRKLEILNRNLANKDQENVNSK